jgi:hypothetical protein
VKPTQQLHAIKESSFYDDVIVPGLSDARFVRAPDRRVKIRGLFCRGGRSETSSRLALLNHF